MSLISFVVKELCYSIVCSNTTAWFIVEISQSRQIVVGYHIVLQFSKVIHNGCYLMLFKNLHNLSCQFSRLSSMRFAGWRSAQCMICHFWSLPAFLCTFHLHLSKTVVNTLPGTKRMPLQLLQSAWLHFLGSFIIIPFCQSSGTLKNCQHRLRRLSFYQQCNVLPVLAVLLTPCLNALLIWKKWDCVFKYCYN